MTPSEAAAIIREANPWPLLAVANSEGENWYVAGFGASAMGVDWSLTTDRVRCSEAIGDAESDCKALALMTRIGKPLVRIWEGLRQLRETSPDHERKRVIELEIDDLLDELAGIDGEEQKP